MTEDSIFRQQKTIQMPYSSRYFYRPRYRRGWRGRGVQVWKTALKAAKQVLFTNSEEKFYDTDNTFSWATVGTWQTFSLSQIGMGDDINTRTGLEITPTSLHVEIYTVRNGAATVGQNWIQRYIIFQQLTTQDPLVSEMITGSNDVFGLYNKDTGANRKYRIIRDIRLYNTADVPINKVKFTIPIYRLPDYKVSKTMTFQEGTNNNAFGAFQVARILSGPTTNKPVTDIVTRLKFKDL